MRVTTCVMLVLAATMLPPSAASAKGPVPSTEVRRIKAEYGSSVAYLPKKVPQGFIFTSWRVEDASMSYLLPHLRVTFGKSGKLIVWTVSDGREDYSACSSNSFYDVKRKIGGRFVLYARGNHGDSASMCLKFSGGRSLGIELWHSHAVVPLTAMQLVASASR